MKYVRKVAQTDYYHCVCLYFQFDAISVFAELVLTSKFYI